MSDGLKNCTTCRFERLKEDSEPCSSCVGTDHQCGPSLWYPKEGIAAIDIDAWNAALEEAIRIVGGTFTNLHAKTQAIERLQKAKRSSAPAYDKDFGDNKLCSCGHTYYRHFDTYDKMAPIGCKYCGCRAFGEWHYVCPACEVNQTDPGTICEQCVTDMYDEDGERS